MEGREENKQVVKGRQEDREDGFEAGWNTNPLETRSPTCVIPVAMEAAPCQQWFHVALAQKMQIYKC